MFASGAGARYSGRVCLAGAVAALAFTANARAAAAAPEAALETIEIHPGLFLIAGAGANIVLQTGADGSVLIDAGTQAAASRTLTVIRSLTDQPVRFILDTSADSDHIGGNSSLARAGRSIFFTGNEPVARAVAGGLGAIILAPVSLLMRISAPTGAPSPFPSDAWPSDAFSQQRKYIYFNGEAIELFRHAAHDDTDSIVLFRRSDVICAGDAIDTDRFPRIDVEHGGSIQGEIEALNHILELSVRPLPFAFEDGGTTIVPAHGHLYQQADVVDYRDMIVIIRDIVQDMMMRGLTLAQIQAATPAEAYEREYGAQGGDWTTADFIAAVYQSLRQDRTGSGAR